jgi:hypothetical protein
MNDEAGSSALLPFASNAISDTQDEQSSSRISVPHSPTNEDVSRNKVRAQQARRATFLDDLIRDVDIVIHCQLSILYYLE